MPLSTLGVKARVHQAMTIAEAHYWRGAEAPVQAQLMRARPEQGGYKLNDISLNYASNVAPK
jgi:hypothetical protein